MFHQSFMKFLAETAVCEDTASLHVSDEKWKWYGKEKNITKIKKTKENTKIKFTSLPTMADSVRPLASHPDEVKCCWSPGTRRGLPLISIRWTSKSTSGIWHYWTWCTLVDTRRRVRAFRAMIRLGTSPGIPWCSLHFTEKEMYLRKHLPPGEPPPDSKSWLRGRKEREVGRKPRVTYTQVMGGNTVLVTTVYRGRTNKFRLGSRPGWTHTWVQELKDGQRCCVI